MNNEAAVCLHYHNDLWFPPFPEDRTGKESEYYEVAKVLCHSCPLRQECGQLGRDEVYGMWGGWTPRERTKGSAKTPTKEYTPEHLAVIPKPNPAINLDIQAVRADLKKVSSSQRARS